MGNHSVTS